MTYRTNATDALVCKVSSVNSQLPTLPPPLQLAAAHLACTCTQCQLLTPHGLQRIALTKQCVVPGNVSSRWLGTIASNRSSLRLLVCLGSPCCGTRRGRAGDSLPSWLTSTSQQHQYPRSCGLLMGGPATWRRASARLASLKDWYILAENQMVLGGAQRDSPIMSVSCLSRSLPSLRWYLTAYRSGACL